MPLKTNKKRNRQNIQKSIFKRKNNKNLVRQKIKNDNTKKNNNNGKYSISNIPEVKSVKISLSAGTFKDERMATSRWVCFAFLTLS